MVILHIMHKKRKYDSRRSSCLFHFCFFIFLKTIRMNFLLMICMIWKLCSRNPFAYDQKESPETWNCIRGWWFLGLDSCRETTNETERIFAIKMLIPLHLFKLEQLSCKIFLLILQDSDHHVPLLMLWLISFWFLFWINISSISCGLHSLPHLRWSFFFVGKSFRCKHQRRTKQMHDSFTNVRLFVCNCLRVCVLFTRGTLTHLKNIQTFVWRWWWWWCLLCMFCSSCISMRRMDRWQERKCC